MKIALIRTEDKNDFQHSNSMNDIILTCVTNEILYGDIEKVSIQIRSRRLKFTGN